jgi:hypothetical protein
MLSFCHVDILTVNMLEVDIFTVDILMVFDILTVDILDIDTKTKHRFFIKDELIKMEFALPL